MPEPRKPAWDDVVCAASSQVSSRVGDEIAILGLDQGVYYGLNSTGARVWDLLQTPIRVREICAALVTEYEVDEDAARRDLVDILARLHDAGLIEVRSASTP
jgi:hypothetical protein